MFDFLLTPETAAAVILAFAAGLIRGYTGFGTPIFLAPVYAVLFGPQAAVPLLIILEIGCVIQLLPAAWPKADWRELAALIAGCGPFLPVGGLLLGVLDPGVVKKIIGLMTGVFVLMLWFGWRYRGPRNAAVRAGIGALSGLGNGLTGIGGPPVVFYYMSSAMDMAAIRANLIIYFAFITAVAVPFFVYAGLVTWETVGRWVVLTPFLLSGVWLGTRFFHGAGERFYYRASLLTMAVSALVGLLG